MAATSTLRARHAQAWADLAGGIAASANNISEAPRTAPPAVRGELTVIGSGIETVGFALGDEELIRGADAVFYCVADPATVVWLRSIRPDAYDLYVLYDDDKVRYTTYMQMTEAMLHFVRRGKRVVAIYYGHPGVFVLSTHRAILLARKEGHTATMRASVSALDCLCADLGVDPAHPGMQTHEATDMLIRRRAPDTTLHVVLWQVGLIGEMGFRRKGYINQNFSIFIDYLQQFYGQEYPVTHYMASRYPTIEPVVERYPLSALHDPTVQTLVTGISTFYLAPKNNADPDVEMLERLGMIRRGQKVLAKGGPLREIGLYGARERKAFPAFAKFRVPAGYQWQEETGASRFLIALKQDEALRRTYAADPERAVASFDGLSERERAKLATRNAGAIQIAAKGVNVSHPDNKELLAAMFANRPLQASLLNCLSKPSARGLLAALDAWSKSTGYAADWSRMRDDIDLTSRDNLFAWSGIYRGASQGNGEGTAERLIVISGSGRAMRVCVDGEPISGFSFQAGTLRWARGNGGNDSGFLRVDIDRAGKRRLIGSIWPKGAIAADYRMIAQEIQTGRRHPANFAGTYSRFSNGRKETLDVVIADTSARGRHLQLVWNGEPLDGSPTYSDYTLGVDSRRFALPRTGNAAGWLAQNGQSGSAWRQAGSLGTALQGDYKVWTSGTDSAFRLSTDGKKLLVNGEVPGSIEFLDSQVRWGGGPPEAPRGTVTMVLDPITLFPALFGNVQVQDGKTLRCHGLVPPHGNILRRPAELGLSQPLWDNLVGLSARPDRPAGMLLWHGAEKANLASYLVHGLLARQLP
ncbi:MAG TPA: SAM-dependent methyltransferase [Bryobacteraceae bacterium]|jgi:hypothetical protein|nr:SAM-dependent methyltransferase [Bryobacteraceae bacterium]